MRSVFYLQLINFIKSPAIFIATILPLILLLTMGYVYPVSWTLPSIVTMTTVALVFFLFGSQLSDLKRTGMIKQIQTSHITKVKLISTIILFTVIIVIIVTGWLFLWAWFLTEAVPFLAQDWSRMNFFTEIGHVRFLSAMRWETFNYGFVLLSILLTILVSIALIMIIVSLTNRQETFLGFTVAYLIAFSVGGGVLFPDILLDTVNVSNPIAKIFPTYYTNNFVISSVGIGIKEELKPQMDYIQYLIDWRATWDLDQNLIPLPPENPGWSLLDFQPIYAYVPELEAAIQAIWDLADSVGIVPDGDPTIEGLIYALHQTTLVSAEEIANITDDLVFGLRDLLFPVFRQLSPLDMSTTEGILNVAIPTSIIGVSIITTGFLFRMEGN